VKWIHLLWKSELALMLQTGLPVFISHVRGRVTMMAASVWDRKCQTRQIMRGKKPRFWRKMAWCRPNISHTFQECFLALARIVGGVCVWGNHAASCPNGYTNMWIEECAVCSLSDKSEFSKVVANCDHLHNLKYRPTLLYAFIGHGVSMLAAALNSQEAIDVKINIMRTFVKLRHYVLSKSDTNEQIVDM